VARQVLTNLDFNNQSKIINLANATNPQDAATLAQLTAAIEGLSTKDNVRAASTGNVSLTSPGTTLDGLTLASGDRILLKDQTDSTQNGLYIFNGSAATLTRSYDASQNPDLLSATVTVDDGTTNKGTSWRQTAVGITLGTTSILWTPFGVVTPPASTTTAGSAALATQAEVNAGTVTNKIVTPQTLAAYTGLPRKIAGTIGDGSATQFDFAHNLNSFDVAIQVIRNASPYDEVIVDTERVSLTTARVRFAVAPASGAFRVVVIG
jgi:hypothetical protein